MVAYPRPHLAHPAGPSISAADQGRQAGAAEGGQIDPARSEDFLGQGWILHLSHRDYRGSFEGLDQGHPLPAALGQFFIEPSELIWYKGKILTFS
jgi:hypothetical protein